MNITASSADSGFKFSREDINKQMDKMKEAKDKSLAEYWPHLGQKVKTEDFDIPMRDGEKVLIRVYTPNESPIESGKRQVVYSYVFGLYLSSYSESDIVT
jgi:predicted acyl esterase